MQELGFTKIAQIQIPPQSTTWINWQNKIIAIIKNSAIRHFHKTPFGEATILKLYAWGEEATEISLPCTPAELCKDKAPWLLPLLERHLADEARHSKLLHERISQLQPNYVRQETIKVDWISRYKLSLMHKLALRYEKQFSNGLLVTIYGAALCSEIMVERVLARHLDQIKTDSSTAKLLSEIITDERHHVVFCRQTLDRLISESEVPILQEYLGEVIKIESKFNILGAFALWLISFYSTFK